MRRLTHRCLYELVIVVLFTRPSCTVKLLCLNLVQCARNIIKLKHGRTIWRGAFNLSHYAGIKHVCYVVMNERSVGGPLLAKTIATWCGNKHGSRVHSERSWRIKTKLDLYSTLTQKKQYKTCQDLTKQTQLCWFSWHLFIFISILSIFRHSVNSELFVVRMKTELTRSSFISMEPNGISWWDKIT